MSDFFNLYDDKKENTFQSPVCTLVTAPTLSLVTVGEAKNYLKVSSDVTLDDALIGVMIKGAEGKIEQELGGVALCQQTWKQTQKGGCKNIKLLRQPILGTPTVSYYEDFSTVTATNITHTTHFRVTQPNMLHHVDGYFEQGRDGDGYNVTFDCGLFSASNYQDSNNPRLQALKTAILRTIAWMYEQRVEFQSGSSEGDWSTQYNQQSAGNNQQALPLGIKHLIMPFHSGEGLI
jgi:uncharacterized phiE125 gp8 family phage protein